MRINLQIQENLTAAFLFLSFMSHFSSLLVSSRPVFVKSVDNQINGTINQNATDSTVSVPSESVPGKEAILTTTHKAAGMLSTVTNPEKMLLSISKSKLLSKTSIADELLPNIPKPDDSSVEHIPQYINDTSLDMAQAKVVKKSPEFVRKLGVSRKPEKEPTLADSKDTSETSFLTTVTNYDYNVNVSDSDLAVELTNVRSLENNVQFSESDVPVCSEADISIVHQLTSACCREENAIPCLCDPTGRLSAAEVSEIKDGMDRLKTGTTCVCGDQQEPRHGEMCQDGRGFDVSIFILSADTDAIRNISDLDSLGNCLLYGWGNITTNCESIIIISSMTDYKIYTSVGVSASSQGLTETCRANINKKYQNIPNTESPATTLKNIIADYRTVLKSGTCNSEVKSTNEEKGETGGLSLYAIIVIAVLATLIVIAAVGYICSEHHKAIKKHRRPSTSQFSPRGSGQAHLYGRQWYTEVTFRRDGPCSYMGIFPRGRGMMYN